jgi:hypothetical protein
LTTIVGFEVLVGSFDRILLMVTKFPVGVSGFFSVDPFIEFGSIDRSLFEI